MSEPEPLGEEAVSLLLALLEADDPVIVGEAATLMRDASAPLIARGLLVEAGHVDVVAIESEYGEELVTLAPAGDEGELGYLGSHGGFVVVPRERLIRHQVDVPRTLAAMLSEIDLPRRWVITALAEGCLWEIPPVRFGKAAGRHSVWFARRLSHRATASAVLQAIERRPPTDGLLILTSTPAEQVSIAPPPTVLVVSLHDVLRRPDSLAAHAGILERRLQGRAAPRNQVEPAWLSLDGRTLRFRCGTEISFHGAAHIAALRKLIDGQRRGLGVRTTDLTRHGSLENLFGHRRWQELKPFLERGHDGWRFKD